MLKLLNKTLFHFKQQMHFCFIYVLHMIIYSSPIFSLKKQGDLGCFKGFFGVLYRFLQEPSGGCFASLLTFPHIHF